MRNIEEVKTDWNDEASIARAEKKKRKLENSGYTLIATKPGLNRSVLVYQKQRARGHAAWRYFNQKEEAI